MSSHHMKDLGTKQDNMYDHPSSAEFKKEDKVYPSLSLPLTILEGSQIDIEDIVKKGSQPEVELKLKAKIVGLHNDEYRKEVNFKLIEGEITSEEEEEGKSLLG